MSDGAAAATLSSRLAAVVVAELIALGVHDFVVCPGSRSQALALAVAEAEREGLARAHVRVDERSAAFFALGIARETGLPAPIIVTSGSAVANLMPAVLEAHTARVPMLLLTADRPAELHGVRASQTVHTNAYTNAFTRFSADIAAPDNAEPEAEAHLTGAALLVREAFTAAVHDPVAPGPTHLNIAFRDPLSGGGGLVAHELTTRRAAAATDHGAADTRVPDEYVHGEDGTVPCAVVIAGADAGPEAEAFAHAAGLPLLAEPSSGSRFGREAVQHWVQLLRDPELTGAIEQVIVFGNPNLTREVPALITRVHAVVIDPAGPEGLARGIERVNPGNTVERFARSARVAEGYDRLSVRPWLGVWIVRDRELRAEHTTLSEPDLRAARATGYKERSAYARAEVARMREPVTREHLTETLWLATWPHDRLVVASSRLIRVLNITAAPRNIRVHSNRGLAGIDGTVATALGIAQASQGHTDTRQAAGTTRVLIGDLALAHDAGSLSLPPEAEGQPRIQLIVGNDGGGTIFDTLEVRQSADSRAFDRVMLTPQRINLEQLAAAYGWSYRRVTTRGELEQVFTTPVVGPEIVEVPLTR